MVNAGYLLRLQRNIGYTFRDISRLEKALTAAGAEGEKDGDSHAREKYEGNRKLAVLGDSIISLVVGDKALFEENASPSTANVASQVAAVKKYQAEKAKSFEIDINIKLSLRQRGQAGPATLRLAVCAIIGAAWQDSGKDFVVAKTVVESLGFGIREHVNLGLIERQHKISASPNTSAVFNDNPEVAGSSLTSSSGTVTAEDDSWAESSHSPQVHYGAEGYGSGTNVNVPIRSTGPQTVDNVDISVQSQSRSQNLEDQNLILLGLENELEEMEWDQRSSSQLYFSMSPTMPPGRSHSSFRELDSDERRITLSPSADVSQNTLQISDRDSNSLSQDIFDEPESSLQSQTRSTEDIESPVSAQRSGTVSLDPNPKKRKSVVNRPGSRLHIIAQLENYILLEKGRCQLAGLPCPKEAFDLAMTQPLTSTPTSYDTNTNLQILWFAIASPESLVILKGLLMIHRRAIAGKQPILGHHLAINERIKVIEGFDDNIAYLKFLKRCHVYQLVIDHSSSSYRTSDGFVNATTESLATRPVGQTGNPNNLADSRVTKLIMKKLYPGLDLEDPEYDKKKRFIGNLHKLGQRLGIFVEAFGYGILGLLPLPVDDLAEHLVPKITDKMILSIPEIALRTFVQRLDLYDREAIRAISAAVSDIVGAIFRGESDGSRKFSLEDVDHAQLLELPRGSPRLLRLISPVTALRVESPTESLA